MPTNLINLIKGGQKMAKFELYQQFQNRKNGRIAHIAKIDDMCKTVILMYDEPREGDKETGMCLSYPTVSKSWKRLETCSYPDISEEEEPKTKEEPAGENQEDAAGDGTPYAEVMQEILTDESRAASQANKEKKSKKKCNSESNSIQDVMDYTLSAVRKLGGEIFVPASGVKMRTFKVGGHMFAKLNYSSKSITLACRSKAVSISPDKTINHLFDAGYLFTCLDEETKHKISTLLTESYNYQHLKNKEKNKEEK